MVRVRSCEGGTVITLCCAVCLKPLTLTTAWLCFPPGADGVEGKWIHKPCGDGRIAELFGQSHATLMRGDAALQVMAANLHRASSEEADVSVPKKKSRQGGKTGQRP